MGDEQQRINRLNGINEAFLKSKKTVSTWTNTIDGQRKGKLVAKALRDEEDEAQRVRLDLEEQMFQQSERKKIIEKAKKLQFEHADRTKEFHSALGPVEILKERELQLEGQKVKKGKMEKAEVDFNIRSRAEHQLANQMEEERVQ